MSLDGIRKKILSDYKARSERIESESEKEAKSVIEAAKVQASERLKASRARAEEEAARLRKESDAGLEIEANSVLLAARSASSEKAAESIAAEVRRILADEAMQQMLKAGTKQFSEASDQDFVVIVSKKNSKQVSQLGLTPRYAEIEGFVLESEDGSMRMTISPESLVEGSMESIRKEAALQLYGAARKESARTPARKHAGAGKQARKRVGKR